MPPDFDSFFLKEYDRISEAYFKTVATIAEFMRHYLTIVAVPPAVAVVFAKPQEMGPLVEWCRQNPFIATAPLFLIAAIGYCLCGYLLALSLNARLYARSVNGIRAHFSSHLDDSALRQIVLPRDKSVPSYREGTFNWVFLAIAIVNSTYAFAGSFAFMRLTHRPVWYAGSIVLGLVVIAHLELWYRQIRWMERKWQSNGD